jgi:hypothetical protein
MEVSGRGKEEEGSGATGRVSRDDDHSKIEKLVHEMSVVVRVQKTHENDY